ncbi:hypothetical protein MTO96_038662 [Rhipicephalus appendiculatus]
MDARPRNVLATPTECDGKCSAGVGGALTAMAMVVRTSLCVERRLLHCVVCGAPAPRMLVALDGLPMGTFLAILSFILRTLIYLAVGHKGGRKSALVLGFR